MANDSYEDAIAGLTKLLRFFYYLFFGPNKPRYYYYYFLIRQKKRVLFRHFDFAPPYPGLETNTCSLGLRRIRLLRLRSVLPNTGSHMTCLIIWHFLIVFGYSEKSHLGDVAAAKIKQLTSELEGSGSGQFDPVEKIKSGFIHFRTEKYE